MKLRISTIGVNNPFWAEVQVTDADRLLPFEDFVKRIGEPTLWCIWNKFAYVDQAQAIDQDERYLGLIDPDVV
jgi:hypothetical protein